MEKTTEEKIDEIHDKVLTMSVQFEAFKDSCKAKHDTLNIQIEDQDHALFGNSKPGIIERFNKFENRAIAYTIAAMMIMQILGPKIVAALGWN